MKDSIAIAIHALLTIRSDDLEQARRGRLLNILLVGLIAAMILIVSALALEIGNLGLSPSPMTNLGLGLANLIGLVLLLLVSKSGRTQLASGILLVALTVATSVLEIQNQEHAVLLYVIPVGAASFLIHPVAAFGFAALSSAGHTLAHASRSSGPPFDYISISGLFLIALLSWLIATNLEMAMQQVRQRAQELDRRVLGRTQDLAEALAREHATAGKLQATLESISDGAIVFDSGGCALVANPAACAVLELSEGDILGKQVHRIMSGAANEDDKRVVSSLVERKKPTHATLKIVWGRKTISVNLAPVRLPQAQQESTVMVLRDITQEAEVDRLKSEFVSIVSHELRTPMTAIKGYVDLMAMGSAGTVTEMQRHYLTIIKTNADRLSDMVNDLLDLSRIEAGKAHMNFQAIPVRRAIYQVVATLQKRFNDQGLRLNVNIAEGLPDALADAGRLTQMITNLLSNAAKYTFEGRVDVTARAVGQHIEVSVADTGIGIPESEQQKIFTRFFRASNAREREIPGTGLGLAITRSLVELHGGRIWFTSAFGQGSIFSFTIPRLPEPLARITPVERPTTWQLAPPEPARILIVDDELHIAQLFRYQLEKDGYTIFITTRPADALTMARRERPDLILLDVMMPGLDGFEVLRQLKQDPETAPIPVVIASIVADEEKGFELGVADYLTKPMDHRQLQTTVRRVLAQHRRTTPWAILVADDEADIRDWLATILLRQGFSITQAQNGQPALECIEAQRPALILLDLAMPEMDGWGVISALKQSPQTASIPVIVLTSQPFGSTQDETRLMGMGVQQIMTKPVQVETLVREVRRHLAWPGH